MNNSDEYITIVGKSAEEVQAAFSNHNLGARDYSILHGITRHQVIDLRDEMASLPLEGIVMATYRRKRLSPENECNNDSC